MRRDSRRAILLVGGLIAAGVAARLYFQDIPNFAPVAGLALFAGYVFRSAWLALCVPLGVMLVSDQVLGGYALPVQLTVYACLAAPIGLRAVLRSWMDRLATSASGLLGAVAGLVGCALGCSVLFFLATNLAVWASGSWYAHSWQGLITCYVNALPFFRYTAAGDVLFALGLFSSYGLVQTVRAWRFSTPEAPLGRSPSSETTNRDWATEG